MKISHRLTLLITAFAVLFALSIGSLLLSGYQSEQAMREVGENKLPATSAILQVDQGRTNLMRADLDISLILHMTPEQRRKAVADTEALIERAMRKTTENLKVYESLLLPEEVDDVRNFNELKQIWDEWVALYRQRNLPLLDKLKENYDRPDIVQLYAEYESTAPQQNAIYQKLRPIVDGMVEFNAKDSEQTVEQALSSQRKMTISLITVGTVLLAGLCLFGFLTYRTIMQGVNSVRSVALLVERSNDFTQRAPVNGRDEIAETVTAFNRLLGRIQQALQVIRSGTDESRDAIRTVATASEQVAVSSAKQSQSASAMAAAVEQLTVSVSHINQSASDALTVANSARDESISSAGIINDSVVRMRQIAATVNTAAATIGQLGEESQKISSIVATIKEVAEQTNLLALNAAIEAARAGEQGRGFAVVADEIRKLAERTANSSLEISSMVTRIQQSSSGAVQEMQQVAKEANDGQQLAEQVGECIGRIEALASRVSDSIGDISGALREQSAASQDIARHVETVAQMTEEGHAASQLTSENAQSMAVAAERTSEQIAQFKIGAASLQPG
ncbi:histidine kinase [Chitiniphilus shinanonensis]|uniref:Histidine kinase n=1 Tax=Chitiniphilus shinanonensis TaxID=553088 RepID=A0ABQ6BRN1_9NEIS|nr:methyl-accepting chemotaxis protein [Chitiniphilus shinanonensis]GLS02902.1 histidine kinase [Chitiniphilus shinanonensis]